MEVITFGETMGLMMPMGNKDFVTATQFQKSFGGAESNVAIGLARLQHQVGWFSLLGKDPFGTVIYKTIRGEGVDVSRVKWTDQTATGLMLREKKKGQVSVHYYRKNSAASTMNSEDLDHEYIRGAKILHVTGITAALSSSCREALHTAIDVAREHGVKICFDPNLRLKLWKLEEAREVLLPLAEKADYFLPGWDECKLLFNTEDEETIFQRLDQLSAICIIKGKGDETVIYEKGSKQSVPFVKVDQVVDTVGAGDAFCAGFLSGVLRGLSIKEAVEIGSHLGAMVIQAEGDWEALPTLEELEAARNDVAHIER